ncbi:Proton-dependent oligopeptide transporter family [Parasponia andersonii]|uniref:Proton-dependent oligopeptide transporter family n=1 Tax=Parasponia andersonii TaxID=3476 RepID=A0A2P5BE18_PARAD|nr:Proton-dependent oligopeptide transporter family [Parasponia andersonii]
MAVDDADTPMLVNAVDGAVDYKGRPASRSDSGGWRSAAFIIGVEAAERFAYYGISSNLVTYLSGPLRQSTAAAAANVNAWGGAALLLPLLGAFAADSFLGRYRTIAMASLLYIFGLGLLTLSAILPSLIGSDGETKIMPRSPPQLQQLHKAGRKPCTQAFGADQFDGQDQEECKAKNSFFNWWYFGASGGAAVTMYSIGQNDKGPFVRIGNRGNSTTPSSMANEGKFLNKALPEPIHLNEDECVCSTAEVEEAKAVLRLVLIWGACLIYAASLQSITGLTIITIIPIYDRIFVPIARAFTRKSSGITMLQRIGTGIVFSTFSMISAVLVEMKRLKTAQEYDPVNRPSFDSSDECVVVATPVLTELRSIGLALYLSVTGVGSFLSSIVVTVIEKATGGDDQDSWFPNKLNLNVAHLDYFYWLLAVVSAAGFATYLQFARSYIYNRRVANIDPHLEVGSTATLPLPHLCRTAQSPKIVCKVVSRRFMAKISYFATFDSHPPLSTPSSASLEYNLALYYQ